jgi:hypothetical protein
LAPIAIQSGSWLAVNHSVNWVIAEVGQFATS